MSEYVDHLREVFEPFGPIQARRMFGGYGIYHDGLMFALVSDDTLYLKADEDCRGHFDAAGLPAFEYPKNGRLVRMSYYLAPEEMLEDPEQAALWARRSYEAALRARKR
ncbi:TfoX/Sxy family protein [Marinobacter sp. CA1]|uniref:TfoX/Sxy family protein n=1 Tax=Marinobacter sp. CA1 TaxID=2817656 RepID=UPI001D06B3F2|nr:TfoX/Sxy family protein [Marinobacter sp. CA1]UDL04100.1 TfoX/Sxy family protein [Marinobacter sp. CA1]